MTATRVKLTQAGESLTMLVESCAKATTGTYPGMEFTGQDGARLVMVEVPESSANRQLGRLSLTPATVVGKVITISRDPNPILPTKPFWGLSLAAGQHATIAPAPKAQEIPLPPPPEDAVALPPTGAIIDYNTAACFALYDQCFAHAIKVVKRASELGLDVDAAAIAATIYIQANKR